MDTDVDPPAPEAVDASAVSPRVSAFNRMTAQALRDVEPVYRRPLAAVREERARWARHATGGGVGWMDVHARGGPRRLRVLAHAAPRGIFLHLHGGGWVFGAADQQDDLLADLRDRAGMTVLSVDYRLAPEHPFPAAVEDAEDVLQALLEDRVDVARGAPIVIGGESAGANLAAVALVRLKAHPRFARVRGASFHYATFDLTGTPSLRAATPETPFLDAKLSRWFGDQYAPRALHAHPDVSPMFADLSGMPPALFLVGTADPVLDDSRLMAARWRDAGNAGDLVELAGGLHGLLEMKTPLTVQGRGVVSAFVRRAVESWAG